MKINIENQPLPSIYKRHGRECYLDSVRQKLIYVTPEETVRQKMISYLANDLKVPAELIIVEQHLSHYHVDSKRRADIIVHGKKGEQNYPVLIVECKAPNVLLDDKAHCQVFDYCDSIGADYVMVCNGKDMYCYKYSEEKDEYEELSRIPVYEEMISGKYELAERIEPPKRISYDRLESYLINEFSSYPSNYYGETISKSTPINIAKAAFNFEEALFDIRHSVPAKDYGIFRVIEDYGIRILSYGNAGGGKFGGPYRSFLIEYNGNTEFISFAFSTYTRSEKVGSVKTCLNVAHDDEREIHHALQLSFDDNVLVNNEKVTFYHNGKIAIGNKGSGKIDELRQFVAERYPDIIDGNRFNLGTLRDDHMWNIDQPDMIKVIVNLISYALIRDEYRDYVKKR